MPHINAETLNSLPQIERRAKNLISPAAAMWLHGAAEFGHTEQRNRDVFRQVALKPRVLTGISDPDCRARFLAKTFESPLIVAPIGHLTQFHQDGELEVAKGLCSGGNLMFVSAQSRLNFEEVQSGSYGANLGVQIYGYGTRDWITAHINKAEERGAIALCVTVDSPGQPVAYSKIDSNYDARRYGRRSVTPPPPNNKVHQLTWKDLDWLRQITELPIVVKGIMTAEDARIAVDNGVDAIWLSNHGGRSLECDISPLETLLEVRESVGSKVPLVVDGGIRTGSDVVKALSLGANMVAIGRPIIYGLIADGAHGVQKTIQLFKEEIESVMAMCGISKIIEISETYTSTFFRKSNKLS